MGLTNLKMALDRVAVFEAEIRALPRAKRAARLAELKATLSAADFAYLKEVLAAPPLKPAKPAQPASDAETKRNAAGAPKPAAPAAIPVEKATPPLVEREMRFLHWRVRPEGGPDYELTEFIGGGGMASVWRAERREAAKESDWPSIAACKIPEGAVSPKAAAEALQAEATLLGEIDHPKVIKCIRPGLASPPEDASSPSHIRFRTELPCYLMEFPPDALSFGKWLKQREDRLRAEPLTCERHVAHSRLLLRIFRDFADTFAKLLHRHSLVHGDESFANLLILPGRKPAHPDQRLIDLGCAQQVWNHEKVGRVGGFSAAVGKGLTPGFASPEQRSPQGRLHRTSGVYSLGAMWFSALAGKSARDMDDLLFKPAPGPEAQRSLPNLFQRVPAEELCAQLTRAICSHGLRQRLLQERERLLTILRGTLTDDVTQRLEMSALREEFDALEKALAENQWNERVRGRPNTAINHPLFGREEDMAAVVGHFAAAGEGPAIVLLTGLGGVGKTALCEAYIDRFHGDYDCILWSTATDEMTFLTSIAEFLVKLGLNRKGVPIEQQRATFLSRISQPGVLWVINNLHDDSKGRNDWLAKWLPSEGTAHILINSRVVKAKIPGLAGGRAVLERRLKPLAEVDALAFLCDRARLPMPTGKELRFAKKLVGHEGLDGLPLAIELCAAVLRSKAHDEGQPMTFAEYWRLFRRDYKVLDWHWEKAATELGRTGKEQLRRVSVVWRQLFELVQEQHPAAAALLRLSAVLPPDDIPVELLRRDLTWPDAALQAVLTIPHDAERDTALFKQLDVLAGHSLIDWNAKTKSWSIHRLVQFAVLGQEGKAAGKVWAKTAARACLQVYATTDFMMRAENLPLGRRLLPVFRATRARWPVGGRDAGIVGAAWRSVGDCALHSADSRLAKHTYQKALIIAEQLVKLNPANAEWQWQLSTNHDRLAKALRVQGRLRESMMFYLRSLQIRERMVGHHPEYREWAKGLRVKKYTVGRVFMTDGDRLTTLGADQRSVETFTLLADQKPDNTEWQFALSTSYYCVGTLHLARGDLKKASKAFQWSLAIRERLASQDPNNTRIRLSLGESLDSLGSVRMPLCDSKRAMSCYQRAQAIRTHLARQSPRNAEWQRALSVSHDKVGTVYSLYGRLKLALQAFQRALVISERLARLDSGNSERLWDLSLSHEKVGDVYLAQNVLKRAMAAYQRALVIGERFARLDPSHAEWGTRLCRLYWKLGLLFKRVGYSDKAFDCWQQAFHKLAAMYKRGAIRPTDLRLLWALKSVTNSSSSLPRPRRYPGEVVRVYPLRDIKDFCQVFWHRG